jgi:hypothetical protein
MSQTLRWNQQVLAKRRFCSLMPWQERGAFEACRNLCDDRKAPVNCIRRRCVERREDYARSTIYLAEISPNETLSPRLGCYLQACSEACHNHLPAEHVD